MFGTLLKGIVFLAVSGFCAFGAIYLNGMPGSFTLRFNGSELRVSALAAICLVVLAFVFLFGVFALFNFGIAVIRFFSGDETAISRYFAKSRQAKGNKALLKALISSYEGDSAGALLQSGRAKYFLKNNPLSLLINAQIAKQAGNGKLVLANYKKLLVHKDTRLVALSGIVSEKIKAGDYEDALKLTKKSVQLNPKNPNNINTLFNLQLLEKDWEGARQTLQAKRKYQKMTRSVFLRQEASLIFAEAQEKRSQGLTKEALDLTLTAVRQNPIFVAALSLLTELELMSGNKKRVEKLLQKGWSLFPHPDIAKSYAALIENESAEDRKVRLEVLTKMKDSSGQTKILEAELCLATQDFAMAKKLMSKLVQDDPDNYTLTLMAAAERGVGAYDSIVQEWLTKAVYAPKSFAWICKNCRFQTEWVCICPECESFDTIEWCRPAFYSDHNENRVHAPFFLEKNSVSDPVPKADSVGSKNRDNLENNLSDNNIEENIELDTVKQAREIS